MRFGIQFHQEIMHGSHETGFCWPPIHAAGIFEIKISLAHRAFYVGDGVAHHAPQPGLRFGAMNDLFDWRVHQPAVENGGVVAAAAPF